MSELNYIRPSSLKEAAIALAEWGEKGRLLAGGTDLLIAMRRGAFMPEAIIDITCLDELHGIDRQDDYVTIGALTTHSEIRHSQVLASSAAMLVNACREIGSVQIRNLATLGGNLANASPAGDSLPALYVLQSEIHLVHLNGDRWVNIEDFFLGPGKTARRPDELITAVRFHPLNPNWKTFFSKLGQRRALRVAKVSATCALSLDGNRVFDCRLALGAVAPTVIRVRGAEETLIGHPLNHETIGEAAEKAAKACAPIDDIRSTVEYRQAMVGVLIRRELEKISKEAK